MSEFAAGGGKARYFGAPSTGKTRASRALSASPGMGRTRAGRSTSVFDTVGAALGQIKDGIDMASSKMLGSSGLSERLDAARAKVDRRKQREERHTAIGKGKTV